MNAATHVIDPWPRYVGNRRIPANGDRMSRAVERYRQGSYQAASAADLAVCGPVRAAAAAAAAAAAGGGGGGGARAAAVRVAAVGPLAAGGTMKPIDLRPGSILR